MAPCVDEGWKMAAIVMATINAVAVILVIRSWLQPLTATWMDRRNQAREVMPTSASESDRRMEASDTAPMRMSAKIEKQRAARNQKRNNDKKGGGHPAAEE